MKHLSQYDIWLYSQYVVVKEIVLLNLLLKLKTEIQGVINAVPNMDERLVLTYRYIKNYTWGQIGEELYADERTIRRWHNRALAHVVVPKDPTII